VMGLHTDTNGQNPTGVIAVTCDECIGLNSMLVAKTTSVKAASLLFVRNGWQKIGTRWLCPDCARKEMVK
jgi:hypothetical protein